VGTKKRPRVESPGYEGPERRDRLVIGTCDCHSKHQRILDDHDREIASIKSSREDQHRDMWTDIKSKVPNKLFYLFISVFSGLFILGIASVYQGMHRNALAFQEGLASVKVTQREIKVILDNTREKVTDLSKEVRTINDHIGPASRRR
jgi:hypothetical protein